MTRCAAGVGGCSPAVFSDIPYWEMSIIIDELNQINEVKK